MRGGWTVEDPSSLLGCERWTMPLLCAESISRAAAHSLRLPKLVTIMPFFCNVLSFSIILPCPLVHFSFFSLSPPVSLSFLHLTFHSNDFSELLFFITDCSSLQIFCSNPLGTSANYPIMPELLPILFLC